MATISIADNDARVQYTQAVTANTTQLTIDFPFFDYDDINVIVTSAAGVDTTLTRGTGTGTFAVTGTSVDDGYSGGYVTLGDTYSDASTKYTIFRDIDVERTTDFPTSGPFNVSALNTELDKLFAIEQELETKIGRTMKLADSDTAATLSLPNLDTRKGTVLAFNTTTGLPEAGPEIGDVSTIAAITTDIATLADIEDGTDATDAIQTVAGISANVTTVAGISNNVSTVAGISSDVTAVAADATDIGAVAAKATEIGRLGTADAVSDLNTLGTADVVSDMNTLGTAANVTNMDTLAGISSNITTVAGISSDVTTVAGDEADIGTVATNIANVNTVAGNNANITTVAGISANVTTVAGDSADIQALAEKTTEIGLLGTADAIADMNTLATSAIVTDMDALADLSAEIDALGDVTADVTTVAGIQADVTTVAGIAANTTTVAGISGNVTTVAGISSNVTTVAGISSDVSAVAADATDIGTVAAADANIGTVATNIANVNTVAGISSNVTTVAGDSADIQTVAGNSADIATVAGISSDVSTVATNNANVTTVASNISGVNSFAERYRVGSSDPTTSLDEGDLAYNSTANQLKYYDGSAWQGIAPGIASVSADASPSLGGNLDTNGNDITFGDNDKAVFGDASDLQIFHDSATGRSYISESGPSAFFIQGSGLTLQDSSGNNFIDCAAGSDVRLFHNASPKLATTATGISVTGDILTNGDLYINDSKKAYFGNSGDLQIYHDASESIIEDVGTGDLKVRGSDEVKIQVRNAANTAWLNAVVAADAGAVTLSHNNSAKLATTASGIDVTGDVLADTVTLDNGSNDWQFSVDGSNNLIVSIAGTAKMKLDSSGNLTVTGDIISEGTI
jgi:hypothetical protein